MGLVLVAHDAVERLACQFAACALIKQRGNPHGRIERALVERGLKAVFVHRHALAGSFALHKPQGRAGHRRQAAHKGAVAALILLRGIFVARRVAQRGYALGPIEPNDVVARVRKGVVRRDIALRIGCEHGERLIEQRVEPHGDVGIHLVRILINLLNGRSRQDIVGTAG